MAKPAPRIPFAEIAYLLVFGAFTSMSIYQLFTGTGTKFTWFFLGIGAFLFVGTAYRMVQNLKKRNTDTV